MHLFNVKEYTEQGDKKKGVICPLEQSRLGLSTLTFIHHIPHLHFDHVVSRYEKANVHYSG